MVRYIKQQEETSLNWNHLFSVFLCLFLLFQSSSIFAEVTASTGRTVLSIDETLVLEIKSENNSGSPDFTELEDDFQIMGRNQSQNYSLINGQASRTHTWNITLLPKKTGEITIPAIKVGKEVTNPIHLVIQKQSSTPEIDGKEVFLKISINDEESSELKQKKQFYVQQQIIVTVKLFHRIRFSNATLSELELTNTVVEKLGNDSNYSKTIANHRYNIIERRYAVYPQQSGELIIPSLTFTGNAEISQNFSLFSRPGRQIISRTKPVALDIMSIPSTYTGKHWLPAESLEIESEIIEDTNSIMAGEAITRNIIVRAQGLLGSQLPVTSVASSKDLKTYPDKEKLSNQLVNGQVMGIRHDTVAIIPLKTGPFSLPEIKIDWWNTKTNQQETTRLPARNLLAQANTENATETLKATPPPVTKVNKPDGSLFQDKGKDKNTNQAEQTEIKTVEKVILKEVSLSKNLWFWISIALLIIWLITLALFIVAYSNNKKSLKKTQYDTVNHSNNTQKNYLQAVYDACQNNNAHKASQALIQWARFYYKQPMLSGLSAIIQLIEDEHLKDAINQLESSQYSQDKQTWDGEALSSALTHSLKQKQSNTKNKGETAPAFSSLNP